MGHANLYSHQQGMRVSVSHSLGNRTCYQILGGCQFHGGKKMALRVVLICMPHIMSVKEHCKRIKNNLFILCIVFITFICFSSELLVSFLSTSRAFYILIRLFCVCDELEFLVCHVCFFFFLIIQGLNFVRWRF